MKNKKMSWRKVVLCFALMVATVFMGIHIPVISAQAATSVQGITISCYPLGAGRVNTYSSANGRYTGYISTNDLTNILEVYGNGWCKVNYPVGGGRKTAYAKTDAFFVDTSFSASWKTASGSAVTYRKANLAGTFGSVSNRDRVITVGYSNGNQQVLYPVSGSVYKLGFVRGTLSVEGTAPATQSKSSIADLCFDYRYYADAYADLKAAYGYDEAQLRKHWYNYGIKEGRGASPIIDLRHYVEKNPDIKGAYGTNYVAAYNHFLQYGYKEYRNSSPYYCGLYYRDLYEDLKPYDSEFLLNHYIQYGIREQRRANTVKYVASREADGSFQMPLENAMCTWRGYTNMSWANNRYGNGYSSQRVYHLGIDIRGANDNVMACGSGTVAATGYNSANGNYVILKHSISGQTVYSFYAHLSSVCVSANKAVSKGQKIGVVGNTGSASAGKHLHFAMMDTLWSKGSYYGYSTHFTGDKRQYGGVTYYNPVYVIQNNRLP